jgi:hypothetical protein
LIASPIERTQDHPYTVLISEFTSFFLSVCANGIVDRPTPWPATNPDGWGWLNVRKSEFRITVALEEIDGK